MEILFATTATKCSKADPQRRRRDIFVETKPNSESSPVRGDIFGKSIVEPFEDVSLVVFHAEVFQQCGVFIAK